MFSLTVPEARSPRSECLRGLHPRLSPPPLSPTLPPYFLPLPAPTRQGSEVEPLPCPSRSFWTVAGRPRRPVAGGCVTPVTSVLDSLSPPL